MGMEQRLHRVLEELGTAQGEPRVWIQAGRESPVQPEQSHLHIPEPGASSVLLLQPRIQEPKAEGMNGAFPAGSSRS